MKLLLLYQELKLSQSQTDDITWLEQIHFAGHYSPIVYAIRIRRFYTYKTIDKSIIALTADINIYLFAPTDVALRVVHVYTIPGAVIGAFIIGICENIIKGGASIFGIPGSGWTTFSDAFTFAFLIVVLVVKPTGLFGEKSVDKV